MFRAHFAHVPETVFESIKDVVIVSDDEASTDEFCIDLTLCDPRYAGDIYIGCEPIQAEKGN